jgi:ABC-type oligopeptide transport system ATPase subunit
MTLLSLENLSKSYGALKVTDDISLRVAQGEIVGILGPNGAGKTTLFNLVAGTVQPNAGRVVFAGQDVTGLDASTRCRMGISRSFQIPHPFNGMTVFENILVGATFGRPNATAPHARAAEVLRLTNIRTNNMRQVGDPGPEGSIGKLMVAELNKDIFAMAMDVLGADAMLYKSYEMIANELVMDFETVQKSFLRSRANTIEGGTTEVMRCQRRKIALEAAHRGAGGTNNNNGIGHGVVLL